MAFRGRGRGWGRGRGAMFETRMAKHVPYIPFPEDVNLPPVPNTFTDEETRQFRYITKLDNFWKDCCYRLEETKSKREDADIERFSDRQKQKGRTKRESLADYLKLTPSNFPSELIQGSKRVRHYKKKLRWDRDSGEQKWDIFAKLEEGHEGQDGEEKKGGSDDEEEEEVEEESSDEDDDYNQNIDFDDDEDDWNMEDEKDEDYYD